MPSRYQTPNGWNVQAFSFVLDPSENQFSMINRFFGARRFAYNWSLAQIMDFIENNGETGESDISPNFYALRKQWNAEKNSVCVDDDTGDAWWCDISKEVFADGVRGATDAYWRWRKSRSGKIAGRAVGFPRFKKRGHDRDRFSFSTGAMRLETDRRHLTLPVLGTIRTQENTRRLERLIALGRAKVLAVTVSRHGDRITAAVRVAIMRPQQAGVSQPSSVIGVDVGVRRLATVATVNAVIAELTNPRALEGRLKELRRLQRQRGRRTLGTRQYQETAKKIACLHAEAAHVRQHTIHVFTTALATA